MSTIKRQIQGDKMNMDYPKRKENHTHGFRSRYMVVSFSLEPDKAWSMPSRDVIWLSLSHKSSSLQSKRNRKEETRLTRGIPKPFKISNLVKFSISLIDVSLLEETSRTRRFSNLDKPSIRAIPLWLRYSSSNATHS